MEWELKSSADNVISVLEKLKMVYIVYQNMLKKTQVMRPQEDSTYAGYHLAYEVKKL
ncbi:hypothetical protein L9F63_025981, partial [Diploptera punctata]